MNSINITDAELDIYSNIFQNSKRLREFYDQSKEIYYTLDCLSEDIYIVVFKNRVNFKDDDEIDPRFLLNKRMIEGIYDDYELDAIKKRTSLKYLNSILATEFIIREFIKNFSEIEEQNFEFKNYIKEYRKIYNLQEENYDRFETLAKNIFNILYESNFFHKILNNAYKEMMATVNSINSWGLDDGKLTAESYDEKVVVSSKLRKMKKVRDISEMTGRFRASASNLQRKRTKEEGQEICGVEIGNEIHRVLPSEKILLGNKKTKRSFMKKYIQKELLSYKYKNNRIQSKGPIICCVDTSTSMEGDLEVWSKSIALTLLDIAHKQRRDFVAILFSYKVGSIIEFNKNRIDPSKIYDLATLFFGSGTNFVEPLTESLRLLETYRYKYADIIFITDGEAPLDDEFIEEFKEIKEKKQFRMITVNVSDKIEEALDEINDIQLLLRDLTDEEVDKTNETIFSI
ncbi:MAG: hypothetical protein Q4P31_02960 [Andreesenia angusta]|nr:hypothetical protein [Andreesenia angusta]